MTDGFNMGSEKRRKRRAVDPSLGYWLGPSTTPEDCPHAPIHCKAPIVAHGAPAVDFNRASAAERPRILDDSQMVADLFAYNVQIDDGPGNLLRHSTARTIDEERTRTLDQTSPSLLSCNEKTHCISSPPPAVHDAPSQRNSITVEGFLQAQSRARTLTKRRNYKQRPKVTIKLDLECLKGANSSFVREEGRLLSKSDDDTLVLPTKRRRKTQSASEYQTARKRRRTKKTKEETSVVQPLELQEEPLPNIATRSLHEHWQPVDSRKGRPFIQPTFESGRHRFPLGPLKPAPVPPLKWTNNSPSDVFHDPQNLPLTKKAPGKQTRTSLSMEPTAHHERKLKLWKSNNVHELSLKQLELISYDMQHGSPTGALHPVHSPKADLKTKLAVPQRNIFGRANIYDSTLLAFKGALRPTEAPKPTTQAEVALKLPAVPFSTAVIDKDQGDQRDQGDQSVVLVEDSFLDLDEPEHVSQPQTAYPPQKLTRLSDILGTLLKTAKEIKRH